MASTRKSLDGWVRHLLASEPPRSKSLLMTIFGDSLLPYVPAIWMSELIALLEPFGVNAQLTRTSAFRLAEEGWLQSRREGRRSLYSLTDSGQQRVEQAYRRIYELPPREWDGRWTVVILNKTRSSAPARAELRRELEWEGFGVAGPGVFLHPRANRANLNEVLRRLGLFEDVVTLQAADVEGVATRSGERLAGDCWNCELVATHYKGFLKRFQSVPSLLGKGLEPHMAFVLQTLLIHSFRRVVLHDPQLPAALLPTDWPGHAAYDLCRSIYRETFLPTRAHLAAHLNAGSQRVLKPVSGFNARLGGLTGRLPGPQSGNF